PRESQQVSKLAAVEREVLNLLGCDNLADTGALRFNHRCLCLYRHLLRHSANLQTNIDSWITAYLQHDASLHILAKTIFRDFKTVRADRQIGQHVAPVWAADGGPHRAGRR